MRRVMLALAVIAIVLGSSAIGVAGQRGGQADTASESKFVTSWFLVRLSEPLEGRSATDTFPLVTPSPSLNALIEQKGIRSIHSALPVSTRSPRSPKALSRHGLDRIYRFHLPEGSNIRELVREFSELPQVDWAEPDYLSRPGAVFPDDPLLSGQWGLNQVSDADVDAPEAWEIATGGPVLVAVLDTGVDPTHEDLHTKWEPGWDFIEGDNAPWDVSGGPYSGHGTRVSSVIGAETDNGIGIAGLCWDCRLMPLRVWNEYGGGGTGSTVTDAVVWATDNGARVINFSGSSGSSSTQLAGVAYAADAGVIHVSITHNQGGLGVTYPGRYAETVAVGATDQDDWRAGFSNYGPEIDLVAPGVDILTADLDDAYPSGSGTSYSAPFVSGVAATMLSMNPSLGREEVRHLLSSGTDDEVGNPVEDVPGFDIYHGWGRLNMESTLAATESTTSLKLEGAISTRVFLDTDNPDAQSYDFVRGDLDALSENALGVELGSVVCLEEDSPDADTAGGNEDVGTPLPGMGFFYLARPNTDVGAGGYGGSSRNRDRRLFSPRQSLEGDQQYSRFGVSVAPAGDVDGDGHDDVIIGADWHEDTEVREGAAFVHMGSSAGLEDRSSWSVTGGQAAAHLGNDVSSAGDVNGDGYDDVIVAALNYGNGQNNEGRVYAYLGSPTGLDTEVHWTGEGDQADAEFGFRIGAAGDVNGDGYDDVIIAARYYGNGENYEGRAYLYRGSASGLQTAESWTFETNQYGAYVTGVASAGDVNNDGYDDVVVSSQNYDGVLGNEGRVFVFHGSASGLPSVPNATRGINLGYTEFGSAVASAGDVDGDGFDDLLVGAHQYSNDEWLEGAAFLYEGSPFGLKFDWTWSFESDQAEAFLGGSVSSAGDVNGDGYDDVLVGCGDCDGSRTNEGRVWLFLGSAAGLSAAPAWEDGSGQIESTYGWTAEPAGDVNGDGEDDMIVGAYNYDNDEADEGRAFVYYGPLSALSRDDCATTP